MTSGFHWTTIKRFLSHRLCHTERVKKQIEKTMRKKGGMGPARDYWSSCASVLIHTVWLDLTGSMCHWELRGRVRSMGKLINVGNYRIIYTHGNSQLKVLRLAMRHVLSRCCCGLSFAFHSGTRLDVDSFRAPEPQPWTPSRNTQPSPTDAYGTIEFQGGPHASKAQVRMTQSPSVLWVPASALH